MAMLVRLLVPDASRGQAFSSALVATNAAGSARVPISATLPQPRRPARYPTLPSTTAQTGVWYVSRYAPQGFRSAGTCNGRNEVRLMFPGVSAYSKYYISTNYL